MWIFRAWLPAAREEGGFTLIEVLVTVSLLGVVLAAALSFSDTGTKVAEKDLERSHAIDEAQSGMAQIQRDLRTATQVLAGTSGDSNAVEFVASKQAGGGRTTQQVRYDCAVPSPTRPTLRACFRYVGPPGSSPGGAGSLVLDQVTNGTAGNPVFRPSASGRFVGIHLERSAAGTRRDGYAYSVTLDQGVYLRNLDGSL